MLRKKKKRNVAMRNVEKMEEKGWKVARNQPKYVNDYVVMEK